MKTPTRSHGMATIALAFATVLLLAVPALADAKRPMALMIMVDGMRADAVETQYMPNLAKLRNGEWQAGYKAAWSMDAQIAPGSIPSSAPNHVSIATGVSPSKHKVTKNGETASKGDFANYPTWLKRVVDADSSKKALFIYKTWEDDNALGPDAKVTFESGADAENAVSLAEKLASADAPDATMYFIDVADAAGHAYGFYPMSDQYRAALQTADGYIGACLNAIANRSTFADEDWLIMVTSDHGGYHVYHGEITVGRQGHTIPLVIAGQSVTAGRIPGLPYNMDVAASALAHFGVTASGIDATLRDTTAVAESSRTLSDGLVAYLPFDTSLTENAVSGSLVSPTANGSVASAENGKFGNYANFPADTGNENYVKLAGSDSNSITYENNAFSATIWVKMPAPTSYDPVIFANKSWSGVGKGFLLFAGFSSQIKYTISGTTIDTCGVDLNAGNASGRIDMGTMDFEDASDWTFYAVTRNADGTITLYQGRKDGALDWLSGELSGSTVATGNPFYIGNDTTGAYGKGQNGAKARAFVGSVDDFGLWTRSLTRDEIRSIYSAGRAGVALGTLVSASAGPATATWTGAVSSDATNPANWSGNAVPTVDTAVTVSGTASITLAPDAALPCKSILFNNVTLGVDADLRGLDAAKIAQGSSIDLNGHALWLRSGSTIPFAVTDSSVNAAHPGELHIDDMGCDIVNTTMVLSGNLRFFKSGAGKFTASETATYTGGFAVEGGTFVMARYVSGGIFVGNGATLDQYGFGLSANPLTLAGGTITNTKQNAAPTLPSAMTLTADSAIVHDNNGSSHDIGVPKNAVWNLGGKTLTVTLQGSDPDFNMQEGTTMTNGTLRFMALTTTYNPQAKGWVAIANLNGRDGLKLDLGKTILRMKWMPSGQTTVNSSVCDFTCSPPSDANVFSARRMEVYGVYTPPQNHICFNIGMMDGSTLDLSAETGSWSCTFNNNPGTSAGGDAFPWVSFADGATVTVNLAGRADLDSIAEERDYIVNWAANAVPADSVTFVLDATTAALPQGYRLRKDSTGLKLTKKTGMVIIMR